MSRNVYGQLNCDEPRRFDWLSGFILLALSLIASFCYGQTPAQIATAKNACEVVGPAMGDGSSFAGTGIYLYLQPPCVLTCFHVVENAPRAVFRCKFRNGEQITGRVATYRAGPADLAVINLDRRPNLPGAFLRAGPLEMGEPLFYCGFSYAGWIQRLGRFKGEENTNYVGGGSGIVGRITGNSVSGMSGGPVIDQWGGVVSALATTSNSNSGETRLIATAETGFGAIIERERILNAPSKTVAQLQAAPS